ncbi:hypothetical protein T4D_15780 [Trichinella pseudospiralis]|uniref:Uncharacterized protein n=1 Tax=Trichinella pseudospiralis TaxID=6337 RepID=A0A0V1FKW8_TRIPS|nr:hypothetical protein T4D_15780 [Trichinella pseudospiralis]
MEGSIESALALCAIKIQSESQEYNYRLNTQLLEQLNVIVNQGISDALILLARDMTPPLRRNTCYYFKSVPAFSEFVSIRVDGDMTTDGFYNFTAFTRQLRIDKALIVHVNQHKVGEEKVPTENGCVNCKHLLHAVGKWLTAFKTTGCGLQRLTHNHKAGGSFGPSSTIASEISTTWRC